MASFILRLVLIVALLTTVSCRSRDVPALPPISGNQLRAVTDFAVIADKDDRSRALFVEASRVFLHPRCANCHPNGDVPSHGMQMTPHQPPVTRGPDGHGVVGMEYELPSGSQSGAGARARRARLASRPARDGLDWQESARDLRADQGS